MARTLYWLFARAQYGFNTKSSPMKGKRHPNGYADRSGKTSQLGGVSIRGVMTLAERKSKIKIGPDRRERYPASHI